MTLDRSAKTSALANNTAGETTSLLNASDGIDRTDSTSIDSSHVSKSPQASGAPSPNATQPADEEKPFPVWQITILCYASIVEPLAFYIIFPYISEMVERVGNQLPENVGFWTGIIESLFSILQMVLIMFYGRIADHWGRKPVLVFSLTGIGAASALFGMSSTLWQMVIFRCLAGFFAGSSATIRAMLSENCTKATQGKAFGWFMFARNLGLFMGPAVGGVLVNPAMQYSAFQNVAFFKDYPYALPGFVSGAFCLSTAIMSFFWLNETLPSKVDSNGKAINDPEMSTWELLKAPGVAVVIYIYSHIMLQALAFTAISPVMHYTPVRLGGFGFPPKLISLSLAVTGASQALWMILGFPYLQRKTSTGTVLRICCVAWPTEMACYPLLNELLRADLRAAFWTVGAIVLIIGSGIAMSFACVQLCLNDIAPSPSTLATLNAVALTVSSGLRAIAPVGMASLYATGIKGGWLHGQLGWIFLTVMGSTLSISVRWLPEEAEGDLKKAKASDEENT